MSKVSFVLAVLCGWVSVTLADPTMYAATKYPAAPPTYPAAPAKYETPKTTYSPPKYEMPMPTTTVKYQVPAKYEAPKYEKKMEEYPMKTEEYKEIKPEYKAEEYSKKPAATYKKMVYGAATKRYRRATDDKVPVEEVKEEVAKKDPSAMNFSAKNIKMLKDAVIESLLSDPVILGGRFGRPGFGFGGGFGRPGFGGGFGRPGFGFGGGFMRPGGMFGRPGGFGFGGGFGRPFFDDQVEDMMMDDGQFFDMDHE